MRRLLGTIPPRNQWELMRRPTTAVPAPAKRLSLRNGSSQLVDLLHVSRGERKNPASRRTEAARGATEIGKNVQRVPYLYRGFA
jgi:hypothetical protein